MKTTKLACFALATLFLSACSNSANKTTPEAQNNKIEITNDMETASSLIPSWQNEKTVVSLKDPVAHSGQFVCATSDTAEFGYTYAELIKNISSVVPKKVSVDGWVYTTVANPKFSIILDMSENGKLYDWKAFPLDSINETGKWVAFSASFYFDKPLSMEQTVKLYPWNQSQKQIYIDDLKITFE